MKHLGIHGLALTLIAIIGCGKKDKAVERHASPEAVAKAFKAAMSEKDWPTGFACMTEESQDQMVGGMVMGAGFSVAFGGDEAKKKSLKELLEKHGVAESGGQDAAKEVKDKGALFGDLVKWIEENSPSKSGRGPGSMAEEIAKVEFSNFSTDGDTATADITVDGKEENDKLHFKKVDGKWYVDMIATQKKGQGKTIRKTLPGSGKTFEPGPSKKKTFGP